MSFAYWLWSVIAPAFVETISDLLDINSTHTGTAYAHLTVPHSCGYIGCVRHVGREAAKKNHLRLLGLEYANFSLHEK